MRWAYIWLGNLDLVVSILIASGVAAGQSIGGAAPRQQIWDHPGSRPASERSAARAL
jgi:hypothetical protein